MFRVSRPLLQEILEAAGAIGLSFVLCEKNTCPDYYYLNNDQLNELIAMMQKAPFGVVTNLISQVEKCEIRQEESAKEDADKEEIEEI